MVHTPEKRRSIYATSLMICVAAIALTGVLSLWGISFGDTALFKIISSLVVIAGLSGFLFTLTFNHDVKIIEKMGAVTGGLAITFSGLVLAQIWFDAFEDAFFAKLIGTIIIIGLFIAFIIAVFDDFFENKKLKDENYLD